MIKRLTLSVMLLAMAAFAMTGAATAFWTAEETATVSIETGNADLQVDARVDCDGGWEAVSEGFDLAWTDIYPGSTTSDCFRVTNTGDAPLDVDLRFGGVTGNQGLLDDLRFSYRANIGNDSVDGGRAPNNPFWTNGVAVGELEAGEVVRFRVNAELRNTDADQNDLQDKSAGFTAFIEGTTP